MNWDCIEQKIAEKTEAKKEHKESFVYAVFNDNICYGKCIFGKLSENLISNNIKKLLELRVFNNDYEIRFIYSGEQGKLLDRYLDDTDNDLYKYEEKHFLDGEWKNGKFQNNLRSCPSLPFDTSKYENQDLKLLIKSYIRFNDDGSAETADWRLAGFWAGDEEVECNG
jgi:hypothetical protein